MENIATTGTGGAALAQDYRAKYPEPSQEKYPTITRQEVLSRMKNGEQAGKDFLIVDLRRNDHEGGFIRGSLNLPVESLYPSLSTLLTLTKSAGVKTVIFHCNSSRGRGNRAAGWFADYLEAQGETAVQSVALFEGILGWAMGGPEYVELMDEYDPAPWTPARAAKLLGWEIDENGAAKPS